MFRHVALFRFVPDATDAQKQAALDELRDLPPQIPELLEYRVGLDAAVSTGNFDLAVVADFADAAGYETYAAHPAHQAVAANHIRPITVERSAVQYEF